MKPECYGLSIQQSKDTKSDRKLLHRQDYRKRRIKQKQDVRFVYSIQCTNKRHQSVQIVQTAGKMQGVQPAFFPR